MKDFVPTLLSRYFSELRLVANAVAISLALYVTLVYLRVPNRTSTIWLPAGIEIGFLLRMPRSQWRASLILYGLLSLIGIAWSGPQRWTLAIAFPLFNTLGAWYTALLLSRDADWVSARSERMAAWLRFAWIGGVAMPLVVGLANAAALMTASTAHPGWGSYTEALLGRFLNNALSVFLIVPMFLRLDRAHTLHGPGLRLEAAGLLVLFATCAAAVLLQSSVMPLFTLPLFVLVLLFRLGFVGTVASMAILLVEAIGGARAGLGPFSALADGQWPRAMPYVQVYLVTVFATIVLMTGLLAERTWMAQRTVEIATEATRLKSDFLAKMSHEIRTPLNAILGFAELLRQDPGLSHDQHQSVTIIDQSGNHLLELINQVLDMAKIDANRMELTPSDVHLARFLDHIVSMLKLRAERRGLALTLSVGDDLPSAVRVDELKLRQVLLNIVGNAIKFTERGEVRLEVESRAIGGQVRALHFSVVDTGPGIAPDERAKLFDAFYQGSAGQHSQGGTGLGLAISQNFVRLMGGEIELDSRPGQGSRFEFSVRVEAASDGAACPARLAPSALAPGQRPPRTLIVDDASANRLLLQRIMERLGIPVVSAAHGAEAVDAFRERPFDLVWMDRLMPGMDGVEAMRQIRALPSGMSARIVCVTADAFGGALPTWGDGGFDAVVVKPISESRLVAVMGDLLGLAFVQDSSAAAPSSDRGQASQAAGDAQLFNRAPADWRQGFCDAVVTGDLRLMQARLDTLPVSHTELHARLRSLIDAIDLAALTALQTGTDAYESQDAGAPRSS